MKQNFLKVILSLVFLALFNGLFFYIGGTNHSEANWISYGFIHAAYLCILLTPLFCKLGSGMAVLSYSLSMRALFYFFTELLLGVICIAISPESATWPLILQGVLLAIFLILQIMSVLANDATVESNQKQKMESSYIKTMADRIRTCLRDVSDEAVKKLVEQCYHAVNNSSIQSYPEALDAELNLRTAVDVFCSAIEEGEYENIDKKAKKVINAVQDRNLIINKCRIN